jgi:hypothetical protein
MSDDREMLELAAKAAGLYAIGDWHSVLGNFCGLKIRPDDLPSGYCWNPLEDDGDALRLAVKLFIRIKTGLDGAVAYTRWDESGPFESAKDDLLAATRRAIVRAAAEIGRSMP